MGLTNDPTIQIMKHVLRFQNARHDVLATNVANATTPGYRAFDLVLQDRIGQSVLEPRRTDPRHLSMTDRLSRAGGEIVRSRATPRLDGNNVSLDQEFMKLTENQMMYQATFQLMDKWGSLSRISRELGD